MERVLDSIGTQLHTNLALQTNSDRTETRPLKMHYRSNTGRRS